MHFRPSGSRDFVSHLANVLESFSERFRPESPFCPPFHPNGDCLGNVCLVTIALAENVEIRTVQRKERSNILLSAGCSGLSEGVSSKLGWAGWILLCGAGCWPISWPWWRSRRAHILGRHFLLCSIYFFLPLLVLPFGKLCWLARWNQSRNSRPRFGLWHQRGGHWRAVGAAPGGTCCPLWRCSRRCWWERQHGLSRRQDALLGAGRRWACSAYFKKLLFLCCTRQVVELPWDYIPDDVCTLENKAQAQDWQRWQIRWFCVSVPSSGEHVWILSC